MHYIPLWTRVFAPVNETPAHAAIIFRERSHSGVRGGRVSESQVKAVALLARRLLSPSIAVPYAFLFSSPPYAHSFSLSPFYSIFYFFFLHTHTHARARGRLRARGTHMFFQSLYACTCLHYIIHASRCNNCSKKSTCYQSDLIQPLN